MEVNMPIGNAMERDGQVYVYDTQGQIICLIAAGSGRRDGLKGYTSDTINIKMDDSIYCYNQKGQIISTSM